MRFLSNPFWLQKEYHQAAISNNKFKVPLFIPGKCEAQAHTTKELEECKAEILPGKNYLIKMLSVVVLLAWLLDIFRTYF